MRRAASGDRPAIAALYERFASQLLGVAIRMLRVRSEAEDVIHDVFVSLPARAQHYAPERGSVAAWLIILTRNLSIDRSRRRVSQARAVEGADPPLPTASPETLAAVASRRDKVRSALAALPELQRTTLQSAFFEGLTYSQIAARDGVPLGTIKARCSRAIAVLREALAGEGLSADDLR